MNALVDLTTEAGIEAAKAIADSLSNVDGKTLALTAIGVVGVAGCVYLGYRLLRPSSAEEQVRAAWVLIEKARQAGAKFIKLRISEDTLAELKTRLKDFFDVKGRRNGFVEVEVHFA